MYRSRVSSVFDRGFPFLLGWNILMKGVSGVPGDLYQIWSGTGTMNTNIPQAQYLTSQYKGHYKPDLSNHWSQLCVDKVTHVLILYPM